ncbi:MAG: hypothetical protein WB626_09040 [Bacteroidota bacterium]
MDTSEESRRKDLERKALLDQIRRSAEEAEMRRLEEEERSAAARGSEPGPDSPPASASGTRASELRERIRIALERRLPQKAAPLLAELRSLAPDDPFLEDYGARLADLEEEQGGEKQAREGRRARGPHGKPPSERVSRQKKIAQFLGRADAFYQQEKYDQALEEVGSVLELDPWHEEALALRDAVEKARDLARRVREEEALKRPEFGPTAPAGPPVPGGKPGEVWGDTPPGPQTQTVYADPEEQSGVHVQKPPLLDRAVDAIGRVRIPLKPIAIAAGVVGAALLVYVAARTIWTTVAPPRYSLLVIPATAAPADTSMDLLAEGLTEDLVQHLAALGEARVLAPATVFSTRHPRGDAQAAARRLGASHYLEWRIERTARGWDVSAELRDTLESRPVWTGAWAVSPEDLSLLKRRIAEEILDPIGIVTSPAEESGLERAFPARPGAYAAWCEAAARLRRSPTLGIGPALAVLERGREEDGSFPGIPALEAWAHVSAFQTETDTSRGRLALASTLAQRALASDPNSALALRALGTARVLGGETQEGTARLEEAVRLAPGDAETWRQLAVAYLMLGRPNDALKAAEHSADRDPLNEAAGTMLGHVRHFRGQYGNASEEDRRLEFEEALSAYMRGARLSGDRTAYESGPMAEVLVYLQRSEEAARILGNLVAVEREDYDALYRLGRIYQAAGKLELGKRDLERARTALLRRHGNPPRDALPLTSLALIQTRLGYRDSAAQASVQAMRKDSASGAVQYALARMFAIQGDRGPAIAHLRRAILTGYRLPLLLDMDFFNVRNDPEFVAALVR